MTSEEFKGIYGIDPPPGATFDGAPSAGPSPPSPNSQALPADRPATAEERRAILGEPSPVVKPPAKKEPLNTSFTTVPTTANGGTASPWEIAMGEEAPPPSSWGTNLVTGNTSVQNPSIGPLSVPGLGLGGGPDAGFFHRVAANITDPRALAITGQSMLSRDPVALAAVIKRNIPEAVFSKDDEGNAIVQVPGNPPMYLDRPGATAQKALYYAPQTAAALLSGGKTIPGMMWRQAGQEAVSNVGSHMLGGAPGWVDPEALLTTAGLTGALGVLGKGAVGLGRGFVNWATDAGESVGASARRLLAKEFGHEPTLGQVTGDPYQLKREDLLLNAKAAPDQSSRLVDLHTGNLQASNDAKTGLIAEASRATPTTPGAPPITPQGFQGSEGAFGDTMLGNVRQRYEALNTAEQTAWGRLGPLSPDTASGRAVSFQPQTSADILGRSYQTLRDRLGLPTGTNGTYSAADLRNGGQSAIDALNVITDRTMGVGSPGAGPTTTGFNLGHLQDMRQKLENIIQAAPNPSAASTVRAMKRNLDSAIADAEANGQLVGSPQALTDFRAANQATADKYAYVAPRNNPAAADFMEGATRQIDTPNGKRYAMTGQEAIDRSLGSGNIVEPGGGTSDVLAHLHGQLGADSDALNAARGVVVKRPLYGRGASPAEPGAEATTGAGYGSTAKRVEAQLRGPGAQVSQQLLDPATQIRMSNFKDALDTLNRSYVPSSPRLNPSGSGYLFSGASKLPIPGFVQDAIQRVGAGASVSRAIRGGQGPVFAPFGAGPPPAGLGPAARTGGLLGTVYGP